MCILQFLKRFLCCPFHASCYQVPVVASFFHGVLVEAVEAGDVGYQNQGFFSAFHLQFARWKAFDLTLRSYDPNQCAEMRSPFRIIQMLVVYFVKIYGIGMIGGIPFGRNFITVGRSSVRQKRVERKSGLQPLCTFRLQAQYNHRVGG